VSRATVALLILQSTEGRIHSLNLLYQNLLNRNVDAGSLPGLLAFLANGGILKQIEIGLLLSNEYFNDLLNGNTLTCPM
jgi:hypothetical protein